MKITISEEFRIVWPQFCVAVVEAGVTNAASSAPLEQYMEQEEERCRKQYTPESLKEEPAIAAVRRAYRSFGKDPSRYRPSCEALVRRTVQGKSLYRVNVLVDINNVVSMRWGYSIGGFDADKIRGDELVLGVGRPGEAYEGIGRGALNIENLPVYRDEEGGIGTPTSDHERTKIGLETRRVVFLINGYDGDEQRTLSCACHLQELLREFAQSDGGSVVLVK